MRARILQRALQTRQLFFQIHNPYPGLTLRRQARSSALRAHSPAKEHLLKQILAERLRQVAKIGQKKILLKFRLQLRFRG